MSGTQELVAVIERERTERVKADRLLRRAKCERACCNPTRFDRIMRVFRGRVVC